jgi:hypothetical protein
MCDAVLCGGGGGALKAEIIGREGGEGLVLGRLGGLRHDGGVVEDHPEAVLVVSDGAFHAVRGPGAQEQLEVFYISSRLLGHITPLTRLRKFGMGRAGLTTAKEGHARLGLLDLDLFR